MDWESASHLFVVSRQQQQQNDTSEMRGPEGSWLQVLHERGDCRCRILHFHGQRIHWRIVHRYGRNSIGSVQGGCHQVRRGGKQDSGTFLDPVETPAGRKIAGKAKHGDSDELHTSR
jgi:hypothetical protein